MFWTPTLLFVLFVLLFSKKKETYFFFLPILCQKSIASAKASIQGPSHHYFYYCWQRMARGQSSSSRWLWMGSHDGLGLCVDFLCYTLSTVFWRTVFLFIYLFIQLLKNKMWFSRWQQLDVDKLGVLKQV